MHFLLNDVPAQAQATERIFQNAPHKSLIIPDIVIVEIVYVLLLKYQLTKEDVIEKIGILLTYEKFKINTALFRLTLDLYARYTISFVDAYLLASIPVDKPTILYTFDKKLLSLNKEKIKTP